MDILIKNGTLVTAERTFAADILLRDGIIAETGNSGTLSGKAVNVIDASGKLILPGGIDPHVHLHLPTPAGFSSDDFFREAGQLSWAALQPSSILLLPVRRKIFAVHWQNAKTKRVTVSPIMPFMSVR